MNSASAGWAFDTATVPATLNGGISPPLRGYSAGLNCIVREAESRPRRMTMTALRMAISLSEFELTHRVLAQPGLLHLAARRHADRLEVLDDPQVARHAEVRALVFRP